MTHVSSLLGRPLWYELMTTDMQAAAGFYEKVVGWTAVPAPQSPQPYTLFNRSGDVGVAGVMTTPADVKAPPFWAMYVGVPTLEDGVAHVKTLGGRECSPVVDVPTVGRMQMVQDPQGAVFYLFQPANTDQAPEAAPQVGDASWHELMTTDAPAAMQFYTALFAWQAVDPVDMGEMGLYHMFSRPHGTIGGMMNKSKEMAEVPPSWGIYFHVPDITSAVERITANGGTVLNGPMEVPGGDWIVNAMDPQGAAFSLHAKKR
ncbi:MAG: VOC family protein [Acidimicrobiia bacterium]|nr:VOC family protein [Acidimicrobiia bacterium]